MQSILVTGCAGFIGSHLCEKLLQLFPKTQVIGIDNFDSFYSKELKLKNLELLISQANFSFFELDIVNLKDLDLLPKVDLVFHLAAKAGVRPSILDPNAYIQTNIAGTQNVLNWMHSRNIKNMVFASSSSIYGNNESIPFKETDNVDNPISPYAFTKKSCELLNYTFHHLCEMNIVNLRFFTVYGPRQRPDLAINKFVSQILKNETIEIFGDGNTARDYTFISDIVDGIISSMQYILNSTIPIYNIFNLGNNKPLKLLDLISNIETVLDKKAQIVYKPMQEGDVNLTFADINKAKSLLQYEPKVDMIAGLKLFLDWKISN
jgi:UDP-glucuronate 4-epimerase